ncbi:MAG TPA: hypothetical protein VGV86_03860 [Acidimicrobiales bacterium]|nr:hypothetical protein [Acidimicrobiales bacterium]
MRFILRYRGTGPAPAGDMNQLRGLEDAVVVDASPRMVLVESDSDPEALRSIVDRLPDWIMAPEQSYALPDVGPRIEHPAD